MGKMLARNRAVASDHAILLGVSFIIGAWIALLLDL